MELSTSTTLNLQLHSARTGKFVAVSLPISDLYGLYSVDRKRLKLNMNAALAKCNMLTQSVKSFSRFMLLKQFYIENTSIGDLVVSYPVPVH